MVSHRASSRFKHYCTLAKLHGLRHTCASWTVQRGESLYLVQSVLGHTTSNVTQRYAHLAPDAMERAFGKVSE